ncbi:MAG: ribonuclease III domain-containing protein [Erysipelotrichaceae bacterium]
MDCMNGTTLAYIGDAVMSLKTREYLVSLGYRHPKILQKKSESYVSAKSQARYLKIMSDNNFFTEEELYIIKKGRNAKTNTIAKNADMITYRFATGMEALWGFLHIEKRYERLDEIWQEIIQIGVLK